MVDSPLDDALKRYDREQAQPSTADLLRAEADERRRRFNALVADFLARMNAVGNPGATAEWEESRFRKVSGWRLTYADDDKLLSLFLTVDGRIPQSVEGRRGELELVPYESCAALFGMVSGLRDDHLGKLGSSMASLLRSHGVT